MSDPGNLTEDIHAGRNRRLINSTADTIELALSGLRHEIGDYVEIEQAIGRVVHTVSELRRVAGEVTL